jgi:hypothetical protein
MAKLTIVYWRDIPAQIIIEGADKTARRQLAQRIQEAIDSAAMRADIYGSDEYMEEWRRADAGECGDDVEAEADAWMARLEAEFDDARLEIMIKNGGLNEAASA